MTEKTYPLKNYITGKTHHFTLGEYEDYLSAKIPESGAHLWIPTRDVPAIMYKPTGLTEQVSLTPEQQLKHVDTPFDSRLYSIWTGDKEQWDQARQDKILETQKKLAAERSNTEVMAQSALSTTTFGASQLLLNAAMGEDAAEMQAMTVEAQPFAHLGGQIGGTVALGFLPIPPLSALTKSRGISNVSNIFEAAAASSQTARSLITGTGFMAELGRRVVGPVTYAAVAEAPLALAASAAYTVDTNKPLTAQNVLGGAITQWSLAVGIAGATSLPLAIAGAAIRTAGKGAIGRVDEALATARSGAPSPMLESAVRGTTRYVERKYLRGKYPPFGDIVGTHVYKVGRRLVKDSANVASETTAGRWLAGTELDDFIQRTRTYKQAIMDVGRANTRNQVKRALQIIDNNVVDDRVLQARIAGLRGKADDIVAGRRISTVLAQKGSDFANDALQWEYQIPPKVYYREGINTHRRLGQGYVESIDALRPHATLGPQYAPPRELIDQLQKLSTVRTGKRPQAISKALNMRLKVPAGEARKAIDRAILEAVREEHGPVFQSLFNQMDEVERTALQVERWARPIREGRGVRSIEELQGLRKSIQPINGIYREFSHKELNVLPKKAAFEEKWFTRIGQARHLNIDTKFDDFADAINTMGEAHKLQAELLADARAIIRATKPMTQKEILAAQVEMLLTNKQRMLNALKYVALKGGGARHTAVYTGVLTFRNLKSIGEKREAFALYRDAILATTSNPTALQEHISQFVGPAAQHDIRLGVPLADGLASAHVYLRQQMPRSDDPMTRSQDFSMAEIENFLEAVGALTDPISVVMTAADGSVTSQSVDAIRSVYPEMYVDMVLDVAEFVHDYGDKLGHAQWLGLDAFTSYALGYTDAPTAALAFRLPSPQTSQQARSLGAIGGPQHRQMDIRMGTTPAQKLGAM